MAEYVTEYKVVEVDTESNESSDDTHHAPCGSVADIYIGTISKFQTAQYNKLSSMDSTVKPHVVNPINIQSCIEDIITRVDILEHHTICELKNISELLRRLNHAIQ